MEGRERKCAIDVMKLKKAVEADTRTPVRKLPDKIQAYIKFNNFDPFEYPWK